MPIPGVAATRPIPAILLARVVTRLRRIFRRSIPTSSRLYTEDFRYLLDLYNRVNGADGPDMSARNAITASGREVQRGNPATLWATC